MKLLMAIVRDDFAGEVVAALNEEGISVTRISSTGGFWRRGNVTLLVGIQEERIDQALQIIDAHAGPGIDAQQAALPRPPRRATIFVLGVNRFEHY